MFPGQGRDVFCSLCPPGSGKLRNHRGRHKQALRRPTCELAGDSRRSTESDSRRLGDLECSICAPGSGKPKNHVGRHVRRQQLCAQASHKRSRVDDSQDADDGEDADNSQERILERVAAERLRNQVLQDHNDILKERAFAAQKKYEQQLSAAKDYEEQLSALKAEHRSLRLRYDTLWYNRNRTADEHKELQKEHKELQKEHDSLSAKHESLQKKLECPVCFESDKQVISQQCRHMLCKECSKQCENCPTCRRPVSHWLDVWF